jgi:long-chain acyl-CoA synthetase
MKPTDTVEAAIRPYQLHGLKTPAKAAIIMGAGEVISHAKLERLVNQREHALRACGLVKGDRFAFQIENSPEFLATALAGLRSGLVVVPLSTLLTSREIGVIVEDSDAKLLIVSTGLGKDYADIRATVPVTHLFSIGSVVDGFASWAELCGQQSALPLDGEAPGREMLYSSGTTGRPKGIVYHGMGGHGMGGHGMGGGDVPGGVSEAVMDVAALFHLSDQTVYLCPAPLYHSAPYAWAIAVVRLGGTLVLMEKFDPEHALRLIEQHRIDTAQFVPTHLVRMLKLPDDVRQACDVSSLKLVIHAAAPCPIEVKRKTIDWFGPIVAEYFGSSEQSVLTMTTTQEWLDHPGSVGRCINGTLHICDENGREVPTGTIGTIYADGGMAFSYHRDPDRTRTAHNDQGWSTVGDVGYLDPDGYLYLTDRGAFLIITGGVNVYPQEIENLLVMHPAIADAAVVGVPDTEMGEIVTAVIQLVDRDQATPAFAADLRGWLRERLSGAKVPRHIVFAEALPRLPTGKMKKHLLLEQLAGR